MSNQLSREQLRDLEQARALEAVERNNFRGLIKFAPRVGKTPIGIRVLARLLPKSPHGSIKVLWVTDNADLRDIHTPKEFEKFGYSNLLSYTKFICYASLKNEVGEYDIIILDEYQNLTKSNSKNLLDKSLYSTRIVGLSATHPKNNTKRYILYTLNLFEIATLTIDEASDMGIINDYRIIVVKYDLDDVDKRIKRVDGKGNIYYISEKLYSKSLDDSIEYYRKKNLNFSNLAEIRRKLIYNNKNKIKIVKSLKQGLTSSRGMVFMPYKLQVEQLGAHYHSTSGDTDYKRFKEKKINDLSLVKVGSVGHTYEDIDYIIIGQITKDFNGLTTQSWARGLTFREGKPVDVYILCASDTIEEEWLKSTLSDVDTDKITYISM